jgi:hypothetical protein
MPALICRSVLIVLASIGVGITVVGLQALKISGRTAYVVFFLWLSAPYLVALFMYWWQCGEVTLKRFLAPSLLLGIAVVVMADSILIHPDPQGGIGVLLIPIPQYCVLVVSSFIKHRANID